MLVDIGRIAFPRLGIHLLAQWLCDSPQLDYRCGGSAGIAKGASINCLFLLPQGEG